jgi:HSP20 family protein
MARLHWSLGRDIPSIHDEMKLIPKERLGRMASQADTRVPSTWMPLVDTYETDDAVVLKVELPGFSRDDFSLEVGQNTLILQGERKQEEEVKEADYHHRECCYGAFERSFLLPSSVDQDGVQATYKDGVLEVRLPKTEVAKPKRIGIAW